MLEEGRRNAMQGMDIDHRIEAAINLTGHQRNVVALLADEKFSSSRSEGVPGKLRKVVDLNFQFCRWRRSPNAFMGLAERTRTRPSWSAGRVRQPLEIERYVATLALARNQHEASYGHQFILRLHYASMAA